MNLQVVSNSGGGLLSYSCASLMNSTEVNATDLLRFAASEVSSPRMSCYRIVNENVCGRRARCVARGQHVRRGKGPVMAAEFGMSRIRCARALLQAHKRLNASEAPAATCVEAWLQPSAAPSAWLHFTLPSAAGLKHYLIQLVQVRWHVALCVLSMLSLALLAQATDLDAADMLLDHPNLAQAIGDSDVVYEPEQEEGNVAIKLHGAERIHNRCVHVRAPLVAFAL